MKKFLKRLAQGLSGRYTMDMCNGPLTGNILMFALPLMLTGILQLLYNAADIVVVGRYAGHVALAAVGSTGSLNNLIVNLFMGLSVGASVAVAQAFGAGKHKDVTDTVHTAIGISIVGGILMGIFGFFMAKPLLQLMDTPPDVIDSAALYMRIIFLGMPFNMVYNFGSAILRAVGDTRRPLYYLTVAGIINVLLNLFFVIVLGMTVDGVAWATIISQMISMVLIIMYLVRAESAIRLDLKKIRIHKPALKVIAKVGLPAGIQGSLFSVSNVLIQSSVNSFGATVMAGNAAASNIEGFVYTSMNAIYQSALTFSSQNLGAKKYHRIDKVMWNCLAIVTVIGLVLGVGAYLLGAPLLSIYNSDPEVISKGLIRLSLVCAPYFLCGIMDVMVGQLRGLGSSVMPMMVSLIGVCGLRVVWIYTVFAANPTLETLYISYPISWAVTGLIHLICYLAVRNKVFHRHSTLS